MDVNKLSVKSNSDVKKSIKFRVTFMGMKPTYYDSRQKKSCFNLLGLIRTFVTQPASELLIYEQFTWRVGSSVSLTYKDWTVFLTEEEC